MTGGYETIVTSVHDRRDLLDRTLRSMLARVDLKPLRIIVHEDARPDHPIVAGETEKICEAIERDFNVMVELITRRPGGGLAPAMLSLLERSRSEFVFYTQEDFDFVRPVPVSQCLHVMRHHRLNHVRFNKRDTLPIKGAHRPRRNWWTKEEVFLDGHTLCVSDHVYFQANLTRRSVLLEGFQYVCSGARSHARCEAVFNQWFNAKYGNGAGSVDGCQSKRRDLLKTFIWGRVGEPRFVVHTGAERRSQGWIDPEHDRKHGTVRGERRR